MLDIDEIVKKLLAQEKYSVDVEHIEKGKNKNRKIFVMDADLAENIFAKTAYELDKEGKK